MERGNEPEAQSCDDKLIAVGEAAGEVEAREYEFLCPPCSEEEFVPSGDPVPP